MKHLEPELRQLILSSNLADLILACGILNSVPKENRPKYYKIFDEINLQTYKFPSYNGIADYRSWKTEKIIWKEQFKYKYGEHYKSYIEFILFHLSKQYIIRVVNNE